MKLYMKLLAAYVQARAEYPKNFAVSVIMVLPYQFVTLFILWGIFVSFDSMMGWNFYELAVLSAMLQLVTGVANGFFRQFRVMEELIIDGELDIYLVRPRSVIFQLAVREVDLISLFGKALPSMVILIFALGKLDVHWTAIRFLFLMWTVIFGSVLFASIFLIIGSLSFFFYRTNEICMTLLYSLQDFVNYPVCIYDRGIRMFISVIFPLAFVNYYPVIFLKTNNYMIVATMVLIAGIAIALSTLVWRYGLKHYQSTGS